MRIFTKVLTLWTVLYTLLYVVELNVLNLSESLNYLILFIIPLPLMPLFFGLQSGQSTESQLTNHIQITVAEMLLDVVFFTFFQDFIRDFYTTPLNIIGGWMIWIYAIILTLYVGDARRCLESKLFLAGLGIAVAGTVLTATFGKFLFTKDQLLLNFALSVTIGGGVTMLIYKIFQIQPANYSEATIKIMIPLLVVNAGTCSAYGVAYAGLPPGMSVFYAPIFLLSCAVALSTSFNYSSGLKWVGRCSRTTFTSGRQV